MAKISAYRSRISRNITALATILVVAAGVRFAVALWLPSNAVWP
ncbi:unnamed protein product, partial [marine sediment metagenome]